MKISLLHPSRGRAEKAAETFDFWMERSSGESDIQHILSLDKDDPDLNKYLQLFDRSMIYINDNQHVVHATNIAAIHADGDILLYLSDDFKCPRNWDLLVKNKFISLLRPMMLKVDDCLQHFDAKVLTIPIMNRNLYNRLGYFWHPDYKSMWVDVDLYFTCHNQGWIIYAPELKFPHEHYSIGCTHKDETYRRSDQHWEHGKGVIAKRRAGGFVV